MRSYAWDIEARLETHSSTSFQCYEPLHNDNPARRMVPFFFTTDFLDNQGGKTAVFEHRDQPEQYYNYQRTGDGHKACQCNNPQVCANYAKEGHRHQDYREAASKCFPCGGPHPSFGGNCRKLYPSLHE